MTHLPPPVPPPVPAQPIAYRDDAEVAGPPVHRQLRGVPRRGAGAHAARRGGSYFRKAIGDR